MQVSPWVARCWDYGEYPASCQGERETKRWRTTVHGEKEVDEGRVGALGSPEGQRRQRKLPER